MAEHTPRPWVAGKAEIGDSHEFRVFVVTECPVDQSQLRANALLIETAPDMVEALEVTVKRFSG